MSAHYNDLAPAVHSEGSDVELGIFKVALVANVAGMDEQALYGASHIASMSALGMLHLAEKFSNDEMDDEGAYQLANAIAGIKLCLTFAHNLQNAARSVRIRRRLDKADRAKAKKAGRVSP